MSLKLLFLETRPQFLLLSPILVFLGMAVALYGGNFNLTAFLLSIAGLVLLHTSVNTLNDYSDYKTGIDFKVNRTPFSGGSGMLPAKALTPRAVFWLGFGSFLLAVPIGIYFVITRGWFLLPLFAVGGVFVLWYSSHITKIGGGSAEIAAGLGLGTLPVFGTYLIMGGNFDWSALYATVPSGIIYGHKIAGIIYSTMVALTYIWVIIGAITRLMPAWTLLALLTLPIGLKAIKGSLTFKSFEELIPAQGANVMIVLLIQLLIGIGYLIAYFTR
jgi:1,4-dihydroxy-2-naphthoate octaprenyltransferase